MSTRRGRSSPRRIACQPEPRSLSSAMFKALFRAAAPFTFLIATPLAAQPIAPGDMLRHIQALASDEFQGRAPGSAGERLTTDYIVRQLQQRGLEPAGENGTWFQPVRLIETLPGRSDVRWTVSGAPVAIDAGEMALIGPQPAVTIADAPVVFAGEGAQGPELRGAVVLIVQGPMGEGRASIRTRVKALADAGAAAVIVVAGAQVPWEMVTRSFARGSTRIEAEAPAIVTGIMPQSAARRLVGAALDQPPSGVATLPLRVSMTVNTVVNRFATNNVLGRVRGSGSTAENVILMAHWDHLGFCRPEGAPDRICNGAVDNASGIAMMIEVAGRLAQQPRPVRDVLVLATTAEEEGLLGATYYAAHPTVPLGSILAAINMDTVAIQHAGSPVAVMGRGLAPLDSAIDSTVAAMGRRLDTDDEAAELVQRQDGWAFNRAGVPAIMVGGSFSDMTLLNRFLEGRYHKPDDQADGEIVLDGAAEDANLTVALARRLADPATYQRPARATP
ncbi:MAG: M28 family peptidase [Alphaproteobacteria bacterium]|nr:MAG: M28 family peptidase [Alphaproteobacteria bacterium]